MWQHLREELGLNVFGNFQFLYSSALPFEFPGGRIVAHERKVVPIWVFEAGFYSAPGLCLRWTAKPDPALRPLLKISHDIFGNQNNVSGAADELVLLRVGL